MKTNGFIQFLRFFDTYLLTDVAGHVFKICRNNDLLTELFVHLDLSLAPIYWLLSETGAGQSFTLEEFLVFSYIILQSNK
ncbi:MAG: hypothetical protein ABI686_00855 [Acidobacteriota bacterium]